MMLCCFVAGREGEGQGPEGGGGDADDRGAGERAAVHHLLGALHRGLLFAINYDIFS